MERYMKVNLMFAPLTKQAYRKSTATIMILKYWLSLAAIFTVFTSVMKHCTSFLLTFMCKSEY